MNAESTTNPEFEKLLDYIKQHRGFDFTGYKRASLERRIQQRMHSVNVADYESYIDYLEVDPDEFIQLFNTILINVTAFLRDPEAWKYIFNIILPKIIAGKSIDEPIRIWSAGSASGEESYSVAMLLAEHLGFEGFKQRVKIYATDMDEEALARARTASYTQAEISEIPENLCEKYFDKAGRNYIFNKELRRAVIFGRHNLIQDAPISRIDLLLCRNILIYFNPETQARVLSRLHYALTNEGYLFLGKAEMLLTHTNLFAPVDIKHRVFSKVLLGNQRRRYLPMTVPRSELDSESFVYMLPKIREAASDTNPVAQLATDANGTLVLANEQARTLFNLTVSDIGRPIQDLKLSYQPVDLRSLIDQAKDMPEPKELEEVPWDSSDSNERFFDISVVALTTEPNKLLGVSLSFIDVSIHKRLQKQLEHTNQELETLNEELQATNEELETLNSEMGMRSSELNQTIAYLNSILASLSSSVMVVNKDYLVEVWNPRSEDLWGLRKEEALGQSFFSLDIGLPVDKLKRSIRSILNGEKGQETIDVAATNRRGLGIQLQGSTTPLFNRDNEIAGVIIILDPIPP